MNKNTIRDKYKSLRKDFTQKNKSLLDKKLLNILTNSDLYKTSNNIMTFISFDTEVDTHNIIKKIIKDKKNIIVPITQLNPKKLLCSNLKSFDDLEIGHYNILTPKKNKVNIITPDMLDLILVPGLVFDNYGYRIGYGGGYYDRFLADKTISAKTLGICYSIQLIEDINQNNFDIPVDYILTEKGIIKTRDKF